MWARSAAPSLETTRPGASAGPGAASRHPRPRQLAPDHVATDTTSVEENPPVRRTPRSPRRFGHDRAPDRLTPDRRKPRPARVDQHRRATGSLAANGGPVLTPPVAALRVSVSAILPTSSHRPGVGDHQTIRCPGEPQADPGLLGLRPPFSPRPGNSLTLIVADSHLDCRAAVVSRPCAGASPRFVRGLGRASGAASPASQSAKRLRFGRHRSLCSRTTSASCSLAPAIGQTGHADPSAHATAFDRVQACQRRPGHSCHPALSGTKTSSTRSLHQLAADRFNDFWKD